MESPKKASVKHIEFHLHREKALTRDLDARCKAFQAQISQLEQDKAELRREKLSLAEDAKKISKLDERVHALLKEIEAKDGIINQMRTAVAEAKSETDTIRYNANTSIASWKVAEEQWISEQSTLNDCINEQKTQIETLQNILNKKHDKLEEIVGNLKKEAERVERINLIRDRLEKELQGLNERLESLQNRNLELGQSIYKLNLDRDQMRETLDYKDTEVKTLEACIAKHLSTEEKLEQMINSLNDRINSARMINLEGKSEKEKLLCDIVDARKENQRLIMQIETLKRDLELSSQTQTMLQKSLDDFRKKYQTEREDLKERQLEVRKHELTISQLTLDLKKSENQCAEWSFRCTSMEKELQQLKEGTRKLKDSAVILQEENKDLKERIEEMKAKLNQNDEEVVLKCTQLEDHIEGLTSDLESMEKQVKDRQEIINDLTNQIGLINEKNTMYHNKILEESGTSEGLQNEIVRQFNEAQLSAREVFTLRCMSEKQEQVMAHLNNIISIFDTERVSLFSLLVLSQSESLSRQKKMDDLASTIASREAICGELQARAEAQSMEVQTLQTKLVEQDNRCTAHTQEMENLRTQLTTTCSLTEEKQQANEKLISGMLRLENEKQEQAERWALKLDQQKRFISTILSQEKTAISIFDEKLSSFHLCAMEKIECFEQVIGVFLEDTHSHLREEVKAKRNALLRGKEMSAFIEEIKASSNSNLIAAMEKQNMLQQKIDTLVKQLQAAKTETKQTEIHLNALLLRFENEQKAAGVFKKESQKALKDEKTRLEEMEKRNRKLRDGLEYEIKRKCEYKVALEEVKRLREEGERYRMKEKETATEAIKSANEETRYWVENFDKFKTIVETSRRTGTRIPSVDPDTCNRLESARSRLSEALQPQRINQSMHNDLKLKRQRVDFCE
ncbi:unnamed protein product [Phytomonas sp. Hart1]|nr:unnamed protein product [Phytomonas sp. Hart1]|eukprot:CCW69014.1 unnamed protein product [Phytomonas sp. isolate Hart1]